MNGTYGQVVSLADVIEVRVPVTNRRCEMRRRPDEVRWLRGARLKYGPDVEIVDISPNGILISRHQEFSANDPVVLALCTTTKQVPRDRSRPSVTRAPNPSAWFETAFRFKRPLETEKHRSPPLPYISTRSIRSGDFPHGRWSRGIHLYGGQILRSGGLRSMGACERSSEGRESSSKSSRSRTGGRSDGDAP